MKNVFYRAKKYLMYRKSKSLILILLFFIICTILLISTSINDTIDDYYNSIENKNGISVSVNRAMSARSGPPNQDSSDLNTSEINEKIAALDYVSDILVSKTKLITSSQIEAITSETNSDETFEADTNRTPRKNNDMDISGLKLLGSSNLSLEQDYQSGQLVLSSGRLPNANNEIMISENLATSNELKLSDQVKLSDSEGENTQKFKVVGIYKLTNAASGFEKMMVPDNTIYTTFAGVDEFASSSANDRSFQQITTKYYLESTADFEQFKEDYYRITNTTSDELEITLNDDIYQNTIKPLVELNNNLNYLKYGILIIAVSILAIVSYLDVKNRQREIGILYSMSESKGRIFAQFVFENTLLLTIAFLIALAISFLSMDLIINGLMSMSIFDSINQGANMMQGGPPMPSADASNTQITATISLLSLVSIYLLLVFVIMIIIGAVSYKALKRRIKDIINE